MSSDFSENESARLRAIEDLVRELLNASNKEAKETIFKFDSSSSDENSFFHSDGRNEFGAILQAEKIIELRKLRNRIFDMSLFGEPAWDMLLDLFKAYLNGKKVSITSLCIASNTPVTTALRYIELLRMEGLIEKLPDPQDRRRAFVMLTETGLKKMFLLLAAQTEAHGT